MGTTPRYALAYPELGDEPHVPQHLRDLAEDVEGWLSRAFPCPSTARPSAPGDGLIIRETDTGDVLMWDGSAWATIGGSGGGGGGGGTVGSAQYSGTAQSIPSGADTVCGFPTADVTSTHVTRQPLGAGHQFRLETTGLWTITTTVRFANAAAAGERYAGIHTPGTPVGAPLAGSGGHQASGPATRNAAVTKQMASGTIVYVNLWQGTGAPQPLEPHSSGGWVRVNLSVVA